ncbi:hypothetical protein G5B30_16755 [Sphingobacterium sp. SGG-5]|uniref:hypothetical protein n=1 Tax=Sphingobacterium sp. SGG-5 TaxID=2710881 RepID=UPI0013EA9F65|nr:hypothetical protein [Sphingobacterium sp. SGG-5]NGM63561.1 hypothetical protein [Sphingobacterium sp. SGG-5]
MSGLTIEDIAEYLVNKTLAKPQLTKKEACMYYGAQRVKFWLKHRLLKPESQNGKNTTIYYNHKDIIKLSREWYHIHAEAKDNEDNR